MELYLLGLFTPVIVVSVAQEKYKEAVIIGLLMAFITIILIAKSMEA